MLFLRCLGSLEVTADEALGPAAGQGRRLAILVVLAVAGERPVTRDALVALLWPETDDGHARAALSQALYSLRRDLRADALILGQQSLRLNPDTIGSDLARFEHAMAEENWAAAVSHYSGDFLDGFHLSGGDTFEAWAAEHRQRLRRQYGTALERLATIAAAAGDNQQASDWWARLARLDPLSHRVALNVAQSIERGGDRASALRYIAMHEQTVRQELGVGLDSALERLRAALLSARTEHTPSPNTVMPEQAPHVAPAARSHTTRESNLSSRRTRQLLLGAAAAAAAIGVVGMARRTAQLETPTPPVRDDTRVVAMSTLEFAGPTSDAFKANIVERLLRSSLLSIPRLRMAQSSDADTTVSIHGAVVTNADAIPIVVTLQLDVDGQPPIQLRAANEEGNLAAAADDLTRQVVAQLARAEDVSALLASASSTTRSIDALRAFAIGEDLFSEGRWKEAEDAFARAVDADSGFALANYRLSEAANWNGHAEIQQRAAERAWRLRASLPLHDRLLVEANWVWHQGDIDGAERGLREVVSRYPWDAEAWYQLAEVSFHSGPSRGRRAQQATVAYERAASLGRDHRGRRRTEALLHLARIAGLNGDTVAFDSLDIALRPVTSGADVDELKTLRACVRNNAPAWRELQRTLASASALAVITDARRCALFGTSLARAAALFASAPSGSLDPTLALGARIEEAALRAAVGDHNTSARMLSSSVGRVSALSLLLHRALFELQSDTPSPARLRAYRDSLSDRWLRNPPTGVSDIDADYGLLSGRFADFVAGLIDLQLRDSNRVRQRVSRLRSMRGELSQTNAAQNFAQTLLAQIALEQRDPRRALAHLDSLLPVSAITQLDYASAQIHSRLLRSRALLEIGQFDEASEVALSIGQRSVFEMLYVREATLLAANALRRAGRATDALAAERRWRERTAIARP